MGVNKDLQKERDSATFDREKLTEVLYGGKHNVERRRYLREYFCHKCFECKGYLGLMDVALVGSKSGTLYLQQFSHQVAFIVQLVVCRQDKPAVQGSIPGQGCTFSRSFKAQISVNVFKF